MLQALSCKPKEFLPGVLLDKEAGIFKLFGKSCPENPLIFYDPIFQWFDKYSEDPLRYTEFDIKLTYFNTASAKILLMIMIKLEKLTDSGHDVKIRWFYNEEDEDMKEAGEEFENIVDVKLEMVAHQNNTYKQKGDDYFNNLMDNII